MLEQWRRDNAHLLHREDTSSSSSSSDDDDDDDDDDTGYESNESDSNTRDLNSNSNHEDVNINNSGSSLGSVSDLSETKLENKEFTSPLAKSGSARASVSSDKSQRARRSASRKSARVKSVRKGKSRSSGSKSLTGEHTDSSSSTQPLDTPDFIRPGKKFKGPSDCVVM